MLTTQLFSRSLARTALLSMSGAAMVHAQATAPARELPPAATPVLSLAAALREADDRGFDNRIATAGAAERRANARVPLTGLLPALRVEAGVMRTTDPIGAFGTTLRQRGVTPAAFDPARLNFPTAVTNAQGALVLDIPLVNSDAWLGLRAARHAVDASRAGGDWLTLSTRTNVIRAYYGAILANAKADVLTQAQLSADASLHQVRAMVAQGLVSKADALQASVRSREVAAQLLGARHDARLALEQLATLLGRSAAALPTLPVELPADAAVRAFAESDSAAALMPTPAAALRDDIRAAAAGVNAAQAERRRATSSLLPRINGFARYDWNDPRTLYAGQKNWTAGVMASWSVFGAVSAWADVAATNARADAATAAFDAARVQGNMERSEAARRLTLSLAQLALAREAVELSEEAQRLVQKRYDGGLATIAELLAATSTNTASALAHAAARYAVIDAIATWRRASGGDPTALIALDAASTSTR